jgi:hypothetical protein
MLTHCKELMEYQNGYVAIHPMHSKLITALRTAGKLITALLTAVENGEGMLDKEATSHDDLFNSFR